MQEGVAKTNCFLLFLSAGAMARPYVQFELRTAIELGKKIVLLHGKFQFAVFLGNVLFAHTRPF